VPKNLTFQINILHSVYGNNTDSLFLCSVRRWLVTANVVPSLPILVTLMKEVLSSFETLVLTRVTWRVSVASYG
jgi:hypothetical protein